MVLEVTSTRISESPRKKTVVTLKKKKKAVVSFFGFIF